jgi:hypothetical protein
MTREEHEEVNLVRRHNRRRFIRGSLFAAAAGGCAIQDPSLCVAATANGSPDLLRILQEAGIPEAAKEIGIDYHQVFATLTANKQHPYSLYRWSVSHDAAGGPLIQALPPEEEMGWTPWEEWFRLGNKPVRRAMVLYPVRDMTRRVPRWWSLEESHTRLAPRCATPAKTLEELFHRNRIFEAAAAVGFDAQKAILDPLSRRAKDLYLRMRWSVTPHRLAADLPVVQCVPPKDRMDQWPWETWYTDGKTALIHHVHYTKPNQRTEPKAWREGRGAPQRPAELIGVDWYWCNEESMDPALSNA